MAQQPAEGRRWSLPALVVLTGAGVALLAATGVLLGALLLADAPPNSFSTSHQSQLDGLVYPEFEQNWKLFAPDPLQVNTDVQARLRSAAGDGSWVDLTAQDVAAIRHNPFPSHADQNLLRRAWDFYDGTHDGQEAPTSGERSSLAVEYLKRIALQRLGHVAGGEPVTGVQLRARTTPVAPPSWGPGRSVDPPQLRELPWWPVTSYDWQDL
ncbi:DUF5819 family protein [Kitasatospora viridis]|uniref:Uncharacterized protein n=1 Tax=Kitasatospora viridis TaxID=281105 RepID=A0A561UHD0_9ACTN|nr:DUF5819 family protein [Kitasatospora viridis]TWF98764.1 hypothetical protein FHX73_112586 [Kitasatospora viridis]